MNSKIQVYTTEELKKADKIVLHKTPLGEVSFIVAADTLMKSYVQAHYRHTEDGKLVFVEGYKNKVIKKPEELKQVANQKAEIEHNEYLQALGQGKKKKAPAKQIDKFNSFHFGDEVFVRYSHMHDQHFGVGAVVGIRDDKSHDGLLVAVKLLDGRLEWYRPTSLAHIHKEKYKDLGREYEVSHHKDNKGNPLPYIHLTEEQRVKFYDLYKLWYRLHRMGEQLAFKQNIEHFKKPDGTLPVLKSQLSADEKIFLENKNPYPIIPYEGLLQAVGQDGYTSGHHTKMVKQLLDDIETLEKKGAPAVQFPKLYKSKSKKATPYISPAWVQGMFPSATTDVEPDPEEYEKLQDEIKKQTGFSADKPSTKGPSFGNATDIFYGQPIIHGKVEEAKPEGSKYKPAPKIPTTEEEQQKAILDLAESMKDAEEAQPKKFEAKTTAPAKAKDEEEVEQQKKEDKVQAAVPAPIVPVDKEAKAEPKLVIHGEQEDISKLKFKVKANAADHGFAGAHSKYILTDENGHQYLFKPYGEGLHRVFADIIPAKLAAAIGLPTADMGSEPVKIKIPHGMGGSYQGVIATGSVQRIIPNIKHNNIEHWIANNFKNCPQDVLEQLQREHVLDWLVGNNDAHAAQFVVNENGKLVGVDKGMAFKFYNSDVLSLDYDPNVNNKIGNNQVYNLMLLAAQKGHIKLDFNVVKDFIDNNVSNVSALAWVKMVTPYAQNSVKWADNVSKFQGLASKRKANLGIDFKKFYKSLGLIDEQGKAAKVATPEPTPALPESLTFQPNAFHQIDSHFHEQVVAAKHAGYSRLIGGGDIEDMNVLFTPYEWHKDDVKAGKTGNGMEVRAKLLAGAEQKVLGWFDTIEDENVTYINKVGQLGNQYDPLAAVVVGAAKTVNHHSPNGGDSPDGEYNHAKMASFAKWFQQESNDIEDVKFDPKAPLLSPEQIADKLMHSSITANNYDDYLTLAHQVASHYHKIAQEVMDAVTNKTKTASKKYEPWSGPYKTKQTSVSKAKHPYATWPVYEVDENDKLIRKAGDKPAQHYDNPANYGCMFTKNLPGNIQVRYYPHYSSDLKGQNNFRSQQGTLLLDFHSWDGNIDDMHKAREVMKDMGIDNRLANFVDMECLYLTRVIWHNRGNTKYKTEYNKVLTMENNEKKVEALKKLCAKTYGGVEPDTLPTYDPTPKWDNENGSHYFMNPYVRHYLHYDKPEMVKVATHNLSAGTTKEVLENVARFGLLATETRHRLGLPYFGQSSAQDQVTGGAAYVFMHSQQKPLSDVMKGEGAGTLIFRPELYARTDCFGYTGDNYGSTNEGWDGHHSIHTRVPIMDIVKNSDPLHEVMFKNRVPLDKWFVGVKAKSTDSSYYGKAVASWVSMLKKAIKKFRPHILNHSTFVGVTDKDSE